MSTTNTSLYPEREQPGVERPLPMRQREYQVNVGVSRLADLEVLLDNQEAARLQQNSDAESMRVLAQMDSVERVTPGPRAVESAANDIEAARQLVDLSRVGEVPTHVN